MARFEYTVVPAPRRGLKAKGVKTPEDRFALALAQAMNELGAEGWEFLRAEALPAEERSGFTGTKTVTQHVLVFRRATRPAAHDDLDRTALPTRPVALRAMPEPPPRRLGPADGEVAD